MTWQGQSVKGGSRGKGGTEDNKQIPSVLCDKVLMKFSGLLCRRASVIS